MTRQYPVFGEVINGLMWDGTEWVPVDGLKPGDQINDQMWTGTHWVQVNPSPPIPQDKLWRKWWFVLMIGFLVLAGIAALDSDPVPPPAASAAVPEDKPIKENPDAPGLNDPVTDGDLEFTVTDVDRGIDEIPGTFNQVHEPTGSFTLVQMTVKNTGDSPSDFDWTNVTGTVDSGTEISSSAVGSYYANPTGQAGPFIGDLNPGALIEVTIVFDVPDGVTLQTVIGRDSLFADGAVISLPADRS